jgi:hypothetical protein
VARSNRQSVGISELLERNPGRAYAHASTNQNSFSCARDLEFLYVFITTQQGNVRKFWLSTFWFLVFGLFFQTGMTLGNLTALAMEPLGHIAGTGASVISAASTLGSVAIATTIVQFLMAHRW